MKVTLAQFSVDSGNIHGNLNLIERFVEVALSGGEVDLICLPEMCTTGFDWKRNAELCHEWSVHRKALSTLSQRHQVDLCGSFLEENEEGKPTNTFLYFDADGQIVQKYNKIHLFSAFREHLHVSPGNEVLYADTRFGLIGCSICYDLRFPELFRKNTSSGARIHILPSAFPKPRLAHWQTLVQARAIENQSFVIAINQTGFEGPEGQPKEVEYFGHSMVVDPHGRVLVEADETEGLWSAEIDLKALESSTSLFNTVQDRRPELY